MQGWESFTFNQHHSGFLALRDWRQEEEEEEEEEEDDDEQVPSAAIAVCGLVHRHSWQSGKEPTEPRYSTYQAFKMSFVLGS